MDAIIAQASVLRGTLSVPPDKAISHRAVLLAALAEGPTRLTPWPAADDCQRTLQVVQGLGVTVERTPREVLITGKGLGGLRPPRHPLDCGESGTAVRLAAGILSGQPFLSTLSAGPLLSRRPMRRVIEPLTQMGAQLKGASRVSGSQEVHPPLSVHGRRPLRAIRYEMQIASAQVKSAVLLAGLFADGRTSVVESQPTRDHTERMLRQFRVPVSRAGDETLVEPGPLISPGTLTIPGDISSAAFFCGAAACVSGSRIMVRDVGLNPTRTGVLEVLRRMGALVEISNADDAWEPRGSLVVEARPLQAVTVEAHEVPAVIDELPILMVAAACAKGTTRFSGVGELRVKETDRIQSMVSGLQQLGVRIRQVASDAVEVEGGLLKGAVVESAGDHRTAMSLAVAGLIAQGRTVIRGADCVAKSFPEFFDLLQVLAGSSTVKSVDKP